MVVAFTMHLAVGKDGTLPGLAHSDRQCLARRRHRPYAVAQLAAAFPAALQMQGRLVQPRAQRIPTARVLAVAIGRQPIACEVLDSIGGWVQDSFVQNLDRGRRVENRAH
jgi:hypothetical protein